MKQKLKFVIYALLYWSGFWLLARWLTRAQTRILMYHGVVQEDISVWTQLPHDQFRAQIKYLAKHYRPVSLTDFVDNKRESTEPKEYRAVVTFDDGLRSNLTLACPILSEYRVPATIYVATALIDRQLRFGGMIWTDYLRGLIRSTRITNLDLSDFGLGRYDLTTDQSRHEAEQNLPRELKKIESAARDKMIATIAERLGGQIERGYAEPFEGMSWDELRTIDKTGLIEIGAHTVNHAILSTISPEQAEEEMVQSKARLEKELNHPIRHFAYPNGTRADFSELHMQMAARHFDSAVSTIEGLVENQHGKYDLRRINIGNDMSLTEFKLRLSGALQLLGI